MEDAVKALCDALQAAIPLMKSGPCFALLIALVAACVACYVF